MTKKRSTRLELLRRDKKIDQRGPSRSAFFSPSPLSTKRTNRRNTHLVVASDQVHRGGVLDLEREQQADGLERVRAAVDVVAEEKIVDVRDVPGSARRAVLFEKAHQVAKLPVQVPEDLHRG